MKANRSAISRYALIISAQKLTQVIKTNTGFLKIHNSKILKRDTTAKYQKANTKKTTEINRDWSKNIS